MLRERDTAAYSPLLSIHIDPTAPFHAFRNQIQQYLREFASMQDSLYDNYMLFGRSHGILPHQCESALTLVSTLSEPLQEFCQFLETPARLPEVIIPLRYLLAMTLHFMEEQIDKLTLLIYEFRIICRTSSSQMFKMKQEIHLLFKSLIKGSEDIAEKVTELLDQARFQERNLATSHIPQFSI